MQPLGTLAFLATLWLLVVVGAAVLEESGAKIAAALKGEPRATGSRWSRSGCGSARSRLQQPMRASAQLARRRLTLRVARQRDRDHQQIEQRDAPAA